MAVIWTRAARLYVLGYPGEVEEFPQPTMGQGILSRMRRWDAIDLSLFQVDAAVDAGQSGGALVTDSGDLIGISSYFFTDARYVIALSAADIVPRLARLLNEDSAAFSDRRPLAQEPETRVTGELDGPWQADLYFLLANDEKDASLDVEGIGTPQIATGNFYGEQVAISRPRGERVHTAAIAYEAPGLYRVQISQNSANRNTYTLSSSHPLYTLSDPDGTQLKVGNVYTDSIDMPGDTDLYRLDLRTGQRVAIEVDSLMIDPFIALIRQSDTGEELVMDDDSGLVALFGTNARLVYVAPEDGAYTVLVYDAADFSVGGYSLTVEKASIQDTPTEAAIWRDYYTTSHGQFARYYSNIYDYSLLYPAQYEDSDSCDETVVACLATGEALLQIMEGPLSELPLHERDQEIILEDLLKAMENSTPGLELRSSRTVTTIQGLTGSVGSLSMDDQGGYMAAFVYASPEMDFVTFVMVALPLPQGSDLDGIEADMDHLFSTFHIVDESHLAGDPAYHLTSGMSRVTRWHYASARTDLKMALMVDESLAEAYAVRALAHRNMGNYDLALADVDAALELDADNYGYLGNRYYLYWLTGEFEKALAATEAAAELNPDNLGILNDRALIYGQSEPL